ncbi:siderophore-iron reductase FhuF [Methylobacterium gnaphalii]|uniref:Siderophore-iron reductase FhuF n=1 Tax=Methylobacterium gnaphalii TaxID=1010610 RepID=A0A512JEA9_9HYPH|nr:siderophore-iron reductase FhuF [Methylobacterium gnaphalii]GEP08282.1 siderophore-iron reductase FhuF [Methylobacterium gnaphalii]GJD67942.1 Ferric iron reductase protein FhuF [Methylobacterium gnaphalii]GLS51087.1 siderophore-iron reductase FhuF [Methylobacterium gnaphalii]
MIAEIAEHVPASLDAYRGGVAADPGDAGALPLSALRDPAVFDAVLARFSTGLGLDTTDRRALVSYWSQFYFAVLATPALTALLCLGRSLPLAFEATSLACDEAGRPACLLVQPDALAAARASACPAADGLTGLMDDHLRPLIDLCREQCGVAPRVLWGNVAVIFDYVAGELGQESDPAFADVASCLRWPGAGARTGSPLARALCPGASGCARRRVCCLRQRLPGIASCGSLCPLTCGKG